MLDRSFQEILYRIDNWINEGSGWIIKSTEAQFVNISIYTPLSGSTYIELPDKLKNPMKGLINIKNNDNKCFLWCHIRHLNPLKIHPERITKVDKNMINDLDYEGIKFPVSKRDIKKIEKGNNIYINVFCYENNLTYFKQLAVPFIIYADFECLLKGVQSNDKNNGSYTEKYQDHIPCGFAYKVVCID